MTSYDDDDLKKRDINSKNYWHDSTCMCNAFICVHQGFDLNLDRFVCCCVNEADCLCMRWSYCLAIPKQWCYYGVEPRGCGCIGDESQGEICKMGCYCCDSGLIKPDCKRCWVGVDRQWCMYSVLSIPLHKDYVPDAVCSYYGLQCLPKCNCFGPSPRSNRLDHIIASTDAQAQAMQAEEMERGGEGLALREN